jgi:hypothetical protein
MPREIGSEQPLGAYLLAEFVLQNIAQFDAERTNLVGS